MNYTKSFADWNEGELDSFLIEITRDIMKTKDEDGSPLVTKILDKAGQKGPVNGLLSAPLNWEFLSP